MTRPRLSLPAGYELERELARRAGTSVVLATRGAERFVLRLEASGGESLAELSVLAAVRHPALARLVDHGPLPGGGRFVARPFVEGRELSALAGERSAVELGRLVGRVARGVAHLHARGFVHGDLKPDNVVVTAEGQPVLIDYGLSSAAGTGERSSAGTPFFVAPERLVGRASDARADVFSLGAILVALLARPKVDARAFYGRFPAEPFLDAAEVPLADLPEWARDLVPALLDRDPVRRPGAGWVASLLGARLDDPPEAAERAPLELDWPPLEGRESFLAARQRAWREDDDGQAETWLLADAAEAARIADAAALSLALRGRSARLVALPREVDGLKNGVQLDRWARETVALEETTTFFVQGLGESPWRRRALAGLAGALAQAARRGSTRARGHRLVVCRGRDEAAPEVSARELEFPLRSEASVLARLRAWLPDADDSALATLAERLHAESRGSTGRLDELTRSLVEEGWILAGGTGRPRLRASALPAHVGRSAVRGAGERIAGLDEAARLALGALLVADAPLDLGALTQRTGLAPSALAGAIGQLVTTSLAESDAASRVRLAGPVRASLVGLDAETWRALHAAAALVPELPPWRRALHAWLGAPTEAPARETFFDELGELRERGATELVLEAVRVALAAPGGRPGDARLLVERAGAWADLGMIDLALRDVTPVTGLDEPRVAARAALVHAQVARLQGDPESARRHALRASEADPALAPFVALDEIRADYAAGRDEAAAARLRALEGRELPRAVRLNLDSVRAMLAFRRGEIDRARAGLEATSRELARSDAPGHEAAALLNLAVVERHVGHLAEAERHLRRAEELVEEDGHPGRLAQVQSVLGAVQRDRGALRQAERTLVTAVEARERLGDAAGADRARGVLGLTLLERGHPRAALALLEGALPRVGPAEHAWLSARAEECRARVGLPVHAPEPAQQKDPRVALALARAASLGGDSERARALAAAAEASARALGRGSLARTSRAVRAWLEGGQVDADADPAAAARAWLVRDPFDPAATLAEARSLEEQGRDAFAARLALAVAARAPEDGLRRQARHLAQEAFERCTLGLEPDERRTYRKNLLGLPDPAPEDLAALDDEDLDMDVLKLLEINQRLVDQEDLARLLGVIVEQALVVTGANRGFLVLEEDGELSLDLALDTRRGDIDEPDVELSHSVVRRALEEGEALRLSNAAEDPVLGHAPSVEALDLRSVLCQPFTVSEDLRGVIYVDNRLEEGSFDQRAERLLGLLAGQAALAIRQVRRLDEIRRLNFELEREVVHKETDLQAAQRALAEQGAPVPVRGLIGESQAMQRVHALLRRVAPAELTVLVTGPSGAGKELAARAVHDLSPRAAGPFVSENCAALPATIIESELFGFVKGAFTGADRDRAGLFERADGGTLFLDEVGELGIDLQAKLLRVLETRVVRRVGGTRETPVDFRLVAATNRDLAEEVRAGRFREDLMYRLDAVRVEMPSLAARTVDIPLLVDHFLRLQRTRDGVARRCSTEVLRSLMAREWPGNVRELANEIARLCVLSDGDLTDPGLVREHRVTAPGAEAGGGGGAIVPIAELEKRAILRAIEATGGDKTRAAELLGISRAKVYQRLKEWGEA